MINEWNILSRKEEGTVRNINHFEVVGVLLNGLIIDRISCMDSTRRKEQKANFYSPSLRS